MQMLLLHPKKNGGFVFFAVVLGLALSICILVGRLQAQSGSVDIGASVTSEIQLTLRGAKNQFGKSTSLNGPAIEFGLVSFINPELISNGDAYTENNHLMLEAITQVDLTFNGPSSVALSLKKFRLSDNPFYKTYYSLSTSRTQVPEEIQTDPQQSRLTSVTESSTINLRLIFEISPRQQGKIFDRFQMEALIQ